MNIIKNNKDSSSPDPLYCGDLIQIESGEIYMIVQSDTATMIFLDWTKDFGADNFNRAVDPVVVEFPDGSSWSSLTTETILHFRPQFGSVKKIKFKLDLILEE